MSKDILSSPCDLFPMIPTAPRVSVYRAGCRDTGQPPAPPPPLGGSPCFPPPSPLPRLLRCHPGSWFCGFGCGSVPRSWPAFSLSALRVLQRPRRARVAGMTASRVRAAAKCIFFAHRPSSPLPRISLRNRGLR